MPRSRDAAVPYDTQWNDYRDRTRVVWGLALGWLPFGASVLAASDASLVPTGLTVPVLLAYMAAFGSAGYRVANFRCPRCGAMFFRTPLRWVRNPLARECRRCGLEKWAGARPLRHRAR